MYDIANFKEDDAGKRWCPFLNQRNNNLLAFLSQAMPELLGQGARVLYQVPCLAGKLFANYPITLVLTSQRSYSRIRGGQL